MMCMGSRYLLQKGADWTRADFEGRNALHYAVVLDSTKCLAAILKHTVDQNDELNAQDNSMMTPLVGLANFPSAFGVCMYLCVCVCVCVCVCAR